jgi:TM2 domain-containing membrane protein YozV
MSPENSEKSRLVALLLCFFLGVFGAHRFYVGKIGTGILMILTIGGLGIWAMIDLIMVLLGVFRDKEGARVYNWFEPDSV